MTLMICAQKLLICQHRPRETSKVSTFILEHDADDRSTAITEMFVMSWGHLNGEQL